MSVFASWSNCENPNCLICHPQSEPQPFPQPKDTPFLEMFEIDDEDKDKYWIDPISYDDAAISKEAAEALLEMNKKLGEKLEKIAGDVDYVSLGTKSTGNYYEKMMADMQGTEDGLSEEEYKKSVKEVMSGEYKAAPPTFPPPLPLKYYPDFDVKVRREAQRIHRRIPALYDSDHARHCPDKPCKIGGKKRLMDLITHLNDGHEWSRNEIADWLEALPVDLTFPVPEDIEEEVNNGTHGDNNEGSTGSDA